MIVPGGQKFDWHNHPKMTGLSKCIHGRFKISSIDYHFLRRVEARKFEYPMEQMRVEELDAEKGPTVSVIEPHAYNIHKIEARELSAFFDLLTPDYPDNTCQFLTTVAIEKGVKVLRELNEPS